MSIERNQELSSKFLYRDTRPLSKKIGDWLRRPKNFRNTCIAYVGVCIVLPILVVPTLFISVGVVLWWRAQKHPLPLRYPEYSDALDPSTLTDKNRKMRPGAGIEFIGNERRGVTIEGGDELWLADSDVRVHRLLMATTGGGKTNTLVSWMLNPLSWGSGFMYADGKAQNTLWVDIYQMADLLWRTDDLLIINYMMGGEDPFASLATGKRGISKRRSNTLNPFGKANHDTINQLLSSMMPKASGDGQQWQSKAVNMMAGVTQVSCYLRAKREREVSVKTLRDNMALQNIIKLSQRTDIPDSALGAIKAYLSVGLPGFNPDNAKAGKPQSQTTLDQHGYLTGQYTRTLGLLGDTYGHIFMDALPEVDMTDVVLNNRILVVMIPTLEMAVEQAGNLGKIVVAATKMMMAANLGADVEGKVIDIVENRPTNTNVPYEVVLDELGYYFADGIDLMFAQGRSLGIGLTASGQDFQAMAKGQENKNGVESMIANTGLKVALKTEDPKETFETFQKAAGEAHISRVSGFDQKDGSANFRGRGEASVEKQSRITLEELRSLAPGDGIVLFQEKVIRASMFNAYDDLKKLVSNKPISLNVLLPIAMPQMHEIASKCRRNDEDKSEKIVSILMAGATPVYPMQKNELLISITAAVASAAAKLNDSVPAVERGITLFVAARNCLKKIKNNEPIYDEGDEEDFLIRPVKKKDPLSFLNMPPFDEEVQIAKPVRAGKANDAVEEFGIDDKPSRRVVLTEKTQKELEDIVRSLHEGDPTASMIASQIESVRSTIDAGCKFEDKIESAKEPPAAFDNINDLMSALDRIERSYADGKEKEK